MPEQAYTLDVSLLPPDSEPVCPNCGACVVFPCAVVVPSSGAALLGYWCQEEKLFFEPEEVE